MEFKNYTRTNIAQMREIRHTETKESLLKDGVSISGEDLKLKADIFMRGRIARNPENHNDQWYVAYDYFLQNFKEHHWGEKRSAMMCGICACEMVMVRGRYPGDEKRKVCPTCLADRLEQIHGIASREYGKAYQGKAE